MSLAKKLQTIKWLGWQIKFHLGLLFKPATFAFDKETKTVTMKNGFARYGKVVSYVNECGLLLGLGGNSEMIIAKGSTLKVYNFHTNWKPFCVLEVPKDSTLRVGRLHA